MQTEKRIKDVAVLYATIFKKTPTVSELDTYLNLNQNIKLEVISSMMMASSPLKSTLLTKDLSTVVKEVFQSIFGYTDGQMNTIIAQQQANALNGGVDGFQYWVNELQYNSDMINVNTLAIALLNGADEASYARAINIAEVKNAVDEYIVFNQNIIPIANAGLDKTIDKGDSIILDASASYDSDGEIISYLWSENGKELSTQKKFTTSFSDIGEHNITLKVTDNDGDINTDQIIVNVTLGGPIGDLQIFGNQSGVWMSGYFQPGYQSMGGLQNNSDTVYTIKNLEILLGNSVVHNMEWGTTISNGEYVQFPAILNTSFYSPHHNSPFEYNYLIEDNDTGFEYEVTFTGGLNYTRYDLDESQITLIG